MKIFRVGKSKLNTYIFLEHILRSTIFFCTKFYYYRVLYSNLTFKNGDL
jgi:hypothetical protein